MKTRRQARLENQSVSQEFSPPKRKKNKNKSKVKTQQEESVSPEKVKKRVKRDKSKSPSPSPKKEPAKRGRKKKRVSEEKEEKEQKKSEEKDQKSEEEEEEIKRVVVKGAAPVDELFSKGSNFHVLVHQGKMYSATLNQSNVSRNNNKYYILQILQSDSNPSQNYFFTKWGRIGNTNSYNEEGPMGIEQAIRFYQKKYNEKTRKGDYIEIELNFGDSEDQEKKDEKKNPNSDYAESTLEKEVKDFVNLIFDIGMMNNHMKEIGYNVNKMPLGKLSKNSIQKGYKVLQELEEELNKKKSNEKTLSDLSSQFYSLIPHDIGHQKMSHFILNTKKKVTQKLQLIESLAEIKIATEILSNSEDGNKIDNNYNKLNRELKNVPKDSYTFQLIEKYMQTTHGETHSRYTLELIDLLECESEKQNERFMKDVGNRMLLWHGSRLTNYVGILSQGLRIAPPEAPVTGYMFGKGVYFADMSSKSANYCFTNPENNTGVLLLCDVALGECNEKLHADYYASNLPDGKHSTKGVGRTAPKDENMVELEGVKIPMGPGDNTNVTGASLQYNEFIVYKVEQIRVKYILRTKFHYK